MCHLIFALPVLALPVFWLLPLAIAGPLYGMALAAAALVYYYAWDSIHLPIIIGREHLRGAKGIVWAVEPVLRVKVDGDIWQACSTEELDIGEAVHVDERKGLTLRVSKVDHSCIA